MAGNLQPFCAAGQASCLCLLRQHKKQRLHTSELGEHKALRTFRFMKLRTVYATLLKGNPMPPSLVCSSLNVRIINHMKKKKYLTLQQSFRKLLSHHINWNSAKPLSRFSPKSAFSQIFPSVSNGHETQCNALGTPGPWITAKQGEAIPFKVNRLPSRSYLSHYLEVILYCLISNSHASQPGIQPWSLRLYIPSSLTTVVLSNPLLPLAKAPYANFREALSEINDNWLIKYA